MKSFFLKFLLDQFPFCGATDCSCFGLRVFFLMGFKSRVDLACTLSCLCVMIMKVTSGATPVFFTNRGVHVINMYMAWQSSHFDPHTCSRQTNPQALVAPRSEKCAEKILKNIMKKWEACINEAVTFTFELRGIPTDI